MVSDAKKEKAAVEAAGGIEHLVAEANEAGKVLSSRGLMRAAISARGAPAPVTEPVPPPPGTYRTIVADPPWEMSKVVLDKDGIRPHLDYATLPTYCPAGGCHELTCKTVECVTGRILGSSAADDGCHLYLWATQKHLPEALALLGKWGFRYECTLVWVKPGGPTPFSWQYNAEFCLFARKGHLKVQPEGIGQKLAFDAPTTGHSRKPHVFFEMVRKASPEPRLEMYARDPHEGFDSWGAEAAA
jgi:N6-adenosine-specific RNA methylase IME4